MLKIGLDFHLRTSTFAIIDQTGRLINTRTVRGDWTKVVRAIKQFVRRRACQICFEATCGYGPLYDALKKFAKRVVVAHPGKLRWIFRSKRKNDRVDAQKLAKLLHLDEVPESHVPSLDVRSWRRMIEWRCKEIEKRTCVKCGLRSLLRNYGIVVPSKPGLWSKQGRVWLSEVEFPSSLASLERDLLLQQIEDADQTVAKVTRELDKIAREHPGVALLQTIPGVGPRTAEAIVAYIDDPKRFAKVSRVGAYFGLVPCQDSSAGVNRLGRITKQGPATARKYLVEAAWQVIRHDDSMRAFFDRIHAGKKDRRKIALVAVAHKLVRCMLAMLRSGETWNPDRNVLPDGDWLPNDGLDGRTDGLDDRTDKPAATPDQRGVPGEPHDARAAEPDPRDRLGGAAPPTPRFASGRAGKTARPAAAPNTTAADTK